MSDRIGFLGFGEAARAFQATLAETVPSTDFVAYDIRQDDEMRSAADTAGVCFGATAATLKECRYIFSAVTADQSLAAIHPLLPSLGVPAVLFDINSVSPGRKREASARVTATGASYVDMAVMAPVHPKGHRTPALVAGPDVAADWLAAAGFDFETVDDAPGAATAIKMVRSVFVKGLEAITVEALLAARRAGCLPRILDSLEKSYPGLGWPGCAEYMLERTLTHGARRAAEMRESAETLKELGLSGGLAAAIADVQELQARARAARQAATLETRIDAALALRANAGDTD